NAVAAGSGLTSTAAVARPRRAIPGLKLRCTQSRLRRLHRRWGVASSLPVHPGIVDDDRQGHDLAARSGPGPISPSKD
ncbi:MAG: hypothetical protein ACLQVF_40350, partial [Isosphaeraceae bacterium]